VRLPGVARNNVAWHLRPRNSNSSSDTNAAICQHAKPHYGIAEPYYRIAELTGPADRGSGPPSVWAISALVVANSSLLVAGLVYMGWAYTDGLWGYFHVSPLNLGVGVVEYLLRSLSLFSPVLVIATVLFITVTAVRAWDLDVNMLTTRARKLLDGVLGSHPRLASWGIARRLLNPRGLMIATGMAITSSGLALAWLAGRVSISTYLLLSFLGAGPLILTWPTRAHRHGRLQYTLAIIVAAVCALWAGSLYAHSLGIEAAQKLVRDLPEGTAVAVYSVQPLALSGPQVTVQDFGSAFRYRYRYEGLRLLTARSGTYYLLPVGWTPQLDLTYILDDSDQIRIELYSAVQSTP
jgi:hypothetical protein